MQRRMLPMITALLAVTASLALSAVGTASAGTLAPQAAAAEAARGGGGGGVTPNSKLPVVIQVTEPGLTVVATLRGVGKQVYKCTNGAPGSPEPVATLEELRGSKRIVGIHGAGPFWASLDGSKVARSGDVVSAKPPAGSPPGVDWLKVPVTSQLGAGVFSKVVFVQRIDTRGGLPPATCTGPVAVDYSTNYVFWATS
jgi:hypothetical protein